MGVVEVSLQDPYWDPQSSTAVLTYPGPLPLFYANPASRSLRPVLQRHQSASGSGEATELYTPFQGGWGKAIDEYSGVSHT